MTAKSYLMPVLLLGAFLITACDPLSDRAVNRAPAVNQTNASRNMNESTAKNVEVKTDLEALEKQINLPVRPLEVKWTAEVFDNSRGAVPGPNDYRLAALLKYDAAGAAALVKKLDAETPEKTNGRADVKTWFPDDLKAFIRTGDTGKYLEGPKYEPNAFFRAPYQNGSLIRVGDTNYFVLNLFSF